MRTGILVLLIAMSMVVSAMTVGASGHSAACENVEGTAQVQAVPTATGFDVYVIDITGPLAGLAAGSQFAWVTVEKITPGGTAHFTGTHRFVTEDFGAFTTSDKGTIAPKGNFHNILTIIDGATGMTHSHGTVDLTTGVVQGRLQGRVCAE